MSVDEEKNIGMMVEDRETDPFALDAEVAERVMGWFRHAGMMHGKAQDVFTDRSGSTRHVYCGCGEDFHPSMGMDAAMEVVEKLRTEGWSFACTLYEGKMPYASFCRGTVASSKNAEADSLPEAICRAALHAMGCISDSDQSTDGRAS